MLTLQQAYQVIFLIFCYEIVKLFIGYYTHKAVIRLRMRMLRAYIVEKGLQAKEVKHD